MVLIPLGLNGEDHEALLAPCGDVVLPRWGLDTESDTESPTS